MVLVTDPNTGRKMRFHDVEWRLAQRMDGTRNIEWLFDYAQTKYATATREQIAQFIGHLERLGLLVDESLVSELSDDFGDATTVEPSSDAWVLANVSDDVCSAAPEKDIELQESETDDVGVIIPFPKHMENGGAFESKTDSMA